ncbi:MAG: signal recognition particle-docking protein FtsY [Acidimicrobiales bacterium]
MLALWIAIAVIGVVVLLGSTAFVVRRRSAPPSAPKTGERGPGTKPSPNRPVTKARPGTKAPAAKAPAKPAAPTRPAPAKPPTPVEPAVTKPAVAGRIEEVVEEPVVAAAVEEPAAPPDLRERMGKTRGTLSGYLRSLRARGSVDDAAWDELEEALLRADVGFKTTSSIIDDLRARVKSGELKGADAVLDALKNDLRESLESTGSVDLAFEEGATNVWLFVGVNGVGKTTTIGKVARRQSNDGRSVILAAGDTFRAAAAEQLELWGERAGVPVVRGAEGGDPSAVVFDAIQRAAARQHNLVLADTAGRLHTKVNLVEELKKIRRVADRPPGHVAEVLLVLDATTGQNGLTQARQFTDAVAVTGVVLTKLDGTAKGGIVIAIDRELGIPVKLVGLGEGAEDLIPFDAKAFVDALFD